MLPRLSATRLIILGFAGLILLGMVLLKFPISNDGISWLDALFESASAVTVTGQQTLDPAKDSTTFGQGVLVVLMQVGGLGIMTVATVVALLLGRLSDLDLGEHGLAIVIVKPEGEGGRIPTGEIMLSEGDMVVVGGSKDKLDEMDLFDG